MSKSKISSDATIEGVINTLDNPKEYVRGVLGNMHRAKKELRSGDVRVRIGTTGRGISPHYLIEDMPCLTNEDWDDIMNPPLLQMKAMMMKNITSPTTAKTMDS